MYRDTLVTQKGFYSEVLVYSRSRGRGIARLVVPPFFYWLYTSEAADIALRNRYVEENGGDLFGAIEQCIEHQKSLAEN
jgi:hypothetical protein